MEGQDGVTAVVLAGGMSRRLGRNKALEPFLGQPLIRRVIERMRRVASDTIVVANTVDRIAELDLPKEVSAVVDEYPGKGSLGGIYTGLNAAPNRWAVFCACDMPFVSPDLYRMLLDRRADCDAVVPMIDGRPEPIHAAYSRDCLDAIRTRIDADDLKIASFFEDVRVDLVPESEVRTVDSHLRSFFNINTQQDLESAQSMAAAEPQVTP